MSRKLQCIMLVDDNPHDNFFHEREIKKNNAEVIIITKHSALEGLEYLKSTNNNDGTHPDLIFLDINMPRMNGWEFLQEYKLLDKELQSRSIVIMLTNSADSGEKAKAKTWDFVSDFITKPLSNHDLKEILGKYFG